MSEQINDKVEVTMEEEEPIIEEKTVEVVPSTDTGLTLVMPTRLSMGQRIVDTAAAMVASTIVVGCGNLVLNGIQTGLKAGVKKIKAVKEKRKEAKLLKKAEAEAAAVSAEVEKTKAAE